MGLKRPEFVLRFGKWTQVWIPPWRARCAGCGSTFDLGFTGTEYLCRTHLAARGSTPEAEGERLAAIADGAPGRGCGGGTPLR